MKIAELFSKYRWKFGFTLMLILFESAINVLFPLAIGIALDGVIAGNLYGTYLLGGLGMAAIVVGGARRFFDSRFYAEVYRKLGTEIIGKIEDGQTSIKTARLGMIGEGVEFLENSLPAIITSLVGMVGVIVMIATLNQEVFLGCLIATLLVFIIYYFTRNLTTRYNSMYNDVLERQVDVIKTENKTQLKDHLREVMHWNIKLSDLEMMNFSISWVVLMGFLIVSIILSTSTRSVEYGSLLALIMYVFQYIESVITLPVFYQNWLRLQEIKTRLEEI